MKLSQKIIRKTLKMYSMKYKYKQNPSMETDLKQNNKRPFSGVASEFIRTNGMLIPSISKAKRNCLGVSSAGTVDYRHGAKIRLLKQFKSTSNEVLKKRVLMTQSRTIFSRSVVHLYNI